MQSRNRRNIPFKHAVSMVLNTDNDFYSCMNGRVYDFENAGREKWSDKILYSKYWKDIDQLVLAFAWSNSYFGDIWSAGDPNEWSDEWTWS